MLLIIIMACFSFLSCTADVDDAFRMQSSLVVTCSCVSTRVLCLAMRVESGVIGIASHQCVYCEVCMSMYPHT